MVSPVIINYDIKGRLSNLVTTANIAGVVKKIQNVEYSFKIDNSISYTINTPEIDTEGAYHSTIEYQYKYDGLNRLIKADASYAKGVSAMGQTVMNSFERGYRYASNGNMTGKACKKSEVPRG